MHKDKNNRVDLKTVLFTFTKSLFSGHFLNSHQLPGKLEDIVCILSKHCESYRYIQNWCYFVTVESHGDKEAIALKKQ